MFSLALASHGLLLPTAPRAGLPASRARPALMMSLPPAKPECVQVETDADAVAAAVLAKVNTAADTAIAARGHFALAIPGGSVLKMLKGSSTFLATFFQKPSP